MRILFWIVAIPFALIVISFAISNRQPVAVDLWPIPDQYLPVTLPLFAVVLVSALFGFFIGAVTAFLSGGRTRARLREERRKAADLEREVKLKDAQAAESGPRNMTEATALAMAGGDAPAQIETKAGSRAATA